MDRSWNKSSPLNKMPRHSHPLPPAGDITRQGVADVSTEKPVEYIFLVLTPADSPDAQVRILELLARVSRNRHLLLKIQSCRTPEEVLSAVQDWEAQQFVSGVEPAP